MRGISFILVLSVMCISLCNAQGGDEPLKIIVFVAHPDNYDDKAGGTAINFVEIEYRVKFVSLTNGDARHHLLGGGALAKLRLEESKEAGRRFGVEYTVLDNHDGELLSTLENRLRLIEEIRNWNAGMVISHRPNDYHTDHRYACVLVQDVAFMVIVPNVFARNTTSEKDPHFLYVQDRFQKPAPFSPDIVVAIDDVLKTKILCHVVSS